MSQCKSLESMQNVYHYCVYDLTSAKQNGRHTLSRCVIDLNGFTKSSKALKSNILLKLDLILIDLFDLLFNGAVVGSCVAANKPTSQDRNGNNVFGL